MDSQADKTQADYIMASEEEMSRLSNQHNIIKHAMSGLLLVPVDLSTGGLKILDSATADGTWVLDLHSDAPGNKFVGTDIDASKFPRGPPASVTFQVQDINVPWPAELHESFDIVHQRWALVAAGASAKAALQNIAGVLKPTGWIQVIEDDNTLANNVGPALKDFIALKRDVFSAMGTSPALAQELPTLLREIGFSEVHEKGVTMQLGSSNVDPAIARGSSYSMGVAASGLIQYARSLPAAVISLAPGRLETLLEDLKAELTERGGGYRVNVVWGRKGVHGDS